MCGSNISKLPYTFHVLVVAKKGGRITGWVFWRKGIIRSNPFSLYLWKIRPVNYSLLFSIGNILTGAGSRYAILEKL